MAIQSKLFDASNSYNQIPTRKTYQREELLSKEIAEDLNTYKNFGVFHTRADVVVPSFDKDGEEIPAEYDKAARSGAIGVRSIFNAYSAAIAGEDFSRNKNNNIAEFEGQSISTPTGMSAAWDKLVKRMSDFRHSNNTPLMDTPETRRLLRQHNDISVKGLVEASKRGSLSRTPYAYSDFMYCKYLNRVPNNYLITLRRYANPVMDNVRPVGRGRKKAGYNRSGLAHPIGTMVTWLGVSDNNMNNILKYSYSMAFEEKTAQWESLNKEGGEGVLNGLEAALNPSTRSMWQQGYANNPLDNMIPGLMNGQGAGGPYSYPPPRDANKVYGPIDRVKKNYRRSGDGLNWDMKFTLNFEYELRAYNGINPRQAMLDLIASILSVTYTSGGFWPGGYYGGGMGQSSTFRNLSIFKATGGFTNYMDALIHDMSTLGQKAQTKIQANGGVMQTIKNIINMIGGLLMGSLINKLGRPAKYHAPSLLSEAPCGLWHITIGNPYRPIVSMGNMILLKTEITHSGPLGLDDFPTQLKVSCEFDRGKPRDQYGVEAIYMNGNDRIYHGMSDKILDAYKAADVYKGHTDKFAYDIDKPGTKSWAAEKKRREEEKKKKEAEKNKKSEPSTQNQEQNQEQKRESNRSGFNPNLKKLGNVLSNAANANPTSNTPGNEQPNNDTQTDATTAAGSNPTAAQSPQEVPIPGISMEELNKKAEENLAMAWELENKIKDMRILKEVFGDPDASVLIWTSKEQQEGSAKKMDQEDPASANTNGEGAGDGAGGVTPMA